MVDYFMSGWRLNCGSPSRLNNKAFTNHYNKIVRYIIEPKSLPLQSFLHMRIFEQSLIGVFLLSYGNWEQIVDRIEQNVCHPFSIHQRAHLHPDLKLQVNSS